MVARQLSTAFPARITMVCTGNICRSPMAEAIARAHVEGSDLTGLVTVDSAGTHDYHVGEDADPRTRRVLGERGYPLAHRARLFEPTMLEQRDLIVAMDAGHLAHLRALAVRSGLRTDHLVAMRDFDPEGPGDVPDPYYDGVAQFREVAAILERSMPGLVAHVRALSPGRQ